MRDSRLSLHSSRLSMWERIMWNFSACSTHISPSTEDRTCSSIAFIPLVWKEDTSEIFSVRHPKSREVIAEAALPKISENTSSSLMLETVRQFCAGFFPSSEVGEYPAVMYQVPKLADIRWRDKVARNQVVLENVRNSLGILLVHFLSPDSLTYLG